MSDKSCATTNPHTHRYCNRCGSEVVREEMLDYPWFCPGCYENMYDFETHTQEENEK